MSIVVALNPRFPIGPGSTCRRRGFTLRARATDSLTLLLDENLDIPRTDEAAILQMRADLIAGLRKFMKAKMMTQAGAAEILGVSQSRVSDLNTGKWERFSLEMLIILATKAGMRVTLKAAA